MLMIGWGIRTRKFEEKMKGMKSTRWIKRCWEEKQTYRMKDWYSIKREKYYNRNEWGLAAMVNMKERRYLIRELIRRSRDVQKQREECKIRDAQYNERYKEVIEAGTSPRYLEKRNIEKIRDGGGIRALTGLRYGNMEEDNKYWEKMEKRLCMFCGKGRDNFEYFIECRITKDWFSCLGNKVEDRLKRVWNDELNADKERMLRHFWKEKDRLREMKKQERKIRIQRECENRCTSKEL